MSTAQLINDFAQPTASLRGKPFWSWNAKLEANELRRQIRVFKQMGFGGFFMHSRLGLATTYLSDQWFDMIKACVDEAQKNNLEAWLYDEDRYPSGAAGGLVTKNPTYRRHILYMTRQPQSQFTWPTNLENTYLFAATFNNDKITAYQTLKQPDDLTNLSTNTEILTFQLRPMPNMSWFNNGAYLDTMNPQAVAEFIKITHETYKKQVGQHFGKTIPGIFTDEPNPGALFREWFDNDGGENAIAWTPNLSQRFNEMFGYDILEHLPEIAYDLTDQPLSRPRYHYHRCKTRLFVEAFAKPIGQWCQQNNLLFTGHTLLEEPGSDNLTMGAVHMQFYPYMQAPGIDVLTQFEDIYITAKQCASVAHQTGRKWVMSELYGGTGWNPTFDTYKHIGDWQTALGVNLRVPHLSYYSMAGEAKRDYPASIHFQSPWYQQYAYLEDYYSRIHAVLTQGQPRCDLLVIHPTETYYALFNKNWESNPTIKKMDADFDQLTRWLLGHHLDFDFADEHLLTELPCTADRDDQGPFFQIGPMKYRAILVPPLLTIRKSTLQWLQKFHQLGGQVTFTGHAPQYLDATPSNEAQNFAQDKTVPFDPDRIAKTLKPTTQTVSIRDPQTQKEITDIFYQLRHIDQDLALFIVNTHREKTFSNIQIKIKTPNTPIKQLQLWDPTTGQRHQLPATITPKTIQLTLNLPPNGSHLIIATSQPQQLPTYQPTPQITQQTPINPPTWNIELDEPNALLLDYAHCQAGPDPQTKFQRTAAEILHIDTELRQHFNINKRGGHMVQPWVTQNDPIGPAVPITLTYPFNVQTIPDTQTLHLAIEQPQRWKIKLNNTSINSQNPNDWWVDPAIKTLPFDTSALQTGQNTLTLTGQFDRLTNLERIYILGRFGVTFNHKTTTITPYPQQLKLGSWTQQNLPFFTGNITYQTTFDFNPKPNHQYLINFQKPACTLLEITLNDAPPIIIAFQNFQTDITPYLKTGQNEIKIKLLSSRQNAFGPLHLPEKQPLCVGPHSYKFDPKNWQDDYNLTPYGLTTPPTIQETTQN